MLDANWPILAPDDSGIVNFEKALSRRDGVLIPRVSYQVPSGACQRPALEAPTLGPLLNTKTAVAVNVIRASKGFETPIWRRAGERRPSTKPPAGKAPGRPLGLQASGRFAERFVGLPAMKREVSADSRPRPASLSTTWRRRGDGGP